MKKIENNNLQKYLDVEEKEIYNLQKKFENKIKEISGLDVEERKKQLAYFIYTEKKKQSLFARYNNFILDIRKPSFLWFLIWVVFSLIGLIQTIKFIFLIF
jgi:hypothetical protein